MPDRKKGGLHEDVSHQGHSKRGHCRPRRHTGKTQLVSSLLFTAGMTPRWGKVAEGTTTTDWDEEEIARKISIQTGLAHAEWLATTTGPSGSSEKVKINFIDLPVYSTFITEAKASLIAADAALITVDAHVGSQLTTEKVWDYCTEQ